MSRESEEDALACIDSALHIGLLDVIDRELLRRRVPRTKKLLVNIADERSESYPESIVRFRLRMAGISSEPQVRVLEERWVDLVIGDRLAIEIDGVGKYTKKMTKGEVARLVHGDRIRDAFLEALGFHVIRLSYRMIMEDWPATLSMIQAVMDRGDHISSTKSMHR